MLITPNKLPRIEGCSIGLDTETTGLDRINDRPFLLTLSTENGDYSCVWDENLVKWLEDNILSAKEIRIFNANFEMHMMINGGVDPYAVQNASYYDILLGEQMLDPFAHVFTLDNAATKYLGEQKDKSLYVALAERFGGPPDKSQMARVSKAPLEWVIPYAERDSNLHYRVSDAQRVLINRYDMARIFRLENQASVVLMKMERRGVPVEMDRISHAFTRANDLIDIVDDEITNLLTPPYRINVNSRKELQYAFYACNLPVPQAFNEETLKKIDHPLAFKILEMRNIRMLRDTFLASLQNYVQQDGKIHATIHQLRDDEGGVYTGRLSFSKPNLQQAPKRKKRTAQILRSLFKDPHRRWMGADWVQFEFFMFGHFAGGDAFRKILNDNPNVDFHQAIADIAHIHREKAKRINLGLVFGMGEGKMAMMMGLPYTEEIIDGKKRYYPGTEAKEIFSKYHSQLPGAKHFIRERGELAKLDGFTTTILGRKIWFPNGKNAHKAGGLVFQGSAADLMKKKLIELDNALETLNNGSELVLVIHDEFDMLCPPEAEEETKKVAKEVLEDMPELSVPIRTDIQCGNDWWEASA